MELRLSYTHPLLTLGCGSRSLLRGQHQVLPETDQFKELVVLRKGRTGEWHPDYDVFLVRRLIFIKRTLVHIYLNKGLLVLFLLLWLPHIINQKLLSKSSWSIYYFNRSLFLYQVSYFLFYFFYSLRFNWHITLCKCKTYLWWFGTHIYCRMLTTVRLVNISFTLHNYHFIVAIVSVRTFKIYFQSSFQVNNAVLLTVVTMLYGRSQKFAHLITESTFWPISPDFLHHSAPGNRHTTVSFYEFNGFRSHI